MNLITLLASPFDELGQDQKFVLMIIAIGCATGILISVIGIIATAITTIHRRKMEIDLKRELLDRGMSAEELTTVIEAAAPPEDAVGRWVNAWFKKK